MTRRRGNNKTIQMLAQIVKTPLQEWIAFEVPLGDDAEALISRVRIALTRVKKRLISQGHTLTEFKLIARHETTDDGAQTVKFVRVRNMSDLKPGVADVDLQDLESALLQLSDKEGNKINV